MENEIRLYERNILINSEEDIKFSGMIRDVEKREIIGYGSKYFKIKEIKEVKISPHSNNDLIITFEGYIDEEAIERDKKQSEEDVLVEKITKAVLEKLEERDKKTVNVEGAEFPDVLLEQINKTIQDSLRQLKQSLESDLKFIDNKKIKNPYPTEKCDMFPY